MDYIDGVFSTLLKYLNTFSENENENENENYVLAQIMK